MIGIGNEYRGDDGVGLAVARAVEAKLGRHAAVIEQSGEGAALMQTWKDAEAVILIDAVRSAAKPGMVHRLDAGELPLPSRFFNYSTHAFSVAEAVEMARALNQLPPRLVVYGIEGRSFEAGVGLSPEVEQAVARVVQCVQEEVEAILAGRPCDLLPRNQRFQLEHTEGSEASSQERYIDNPR